MPKAVLAIVVALLASSPAFAARRLTVEQLSREVASFAKKNDSKVAGQLYGLQLTERLSAKKLANLEAELPGPDSRRALVALADQAEFLDPPPAEISNRPAPTVTDQRAIIAKSIDYVEATLHRLPDLYARQDTIRYADTPAGLRNERTDTIIPYQPLHPVSRSVETVLYSDGREVLQKRAGQKRSSTSTNGMITFGEFGALFPVLYGDLPKGNLRWGYWEQGPAGLEAVFRFNVPKADSHYLVQYCCVGGGLFKQFPAYHGEITLDPSKGTILRVTLVADMASNDPLTQSDLMVAYGPVELGGKKYFCPVKSISISRAPAQLMQGIKPRGMFGAPLPEDSESKAAMQTLLNETVFDQYHLFRGDVQVLTANNPNNESAPEEPANASTARSSTTASVEQPEFTNESAAPAGPAPAAVAASESPEKSAPASPATPQLNASSEKSAAASAQSSSTAAVPPAAAMAGSAATPASEASSSEMAVVASASIPQTPAPLAPSSGKPGFALRLNVRLVDVDVTAFDKKGKPITDLTKQDFEIYDNGKKQTVASFTHLTGAVPPNPQAPAATEQPVLYSNLPQAVGGTRSVGFAPLQSSTIILLDPTSLSFADLNHARQQILKFLDHIPESEAVGIYIRTGPGFRILAGQTTDHAALISALRKWAPTAQDFARAQEAEMRNRQLFDSAGSVDAMASVNGNIVMPGSSTGYMGVSDPKLRDTGNDPTHIALAVLIAIAARMEAIPGHKNLIWVASDNVLANWSDQQPSTSADQTAKLDPIRIRAQEALNNSHVSLYPLDASQLETPGADASLENPAVELSESQETMHPNANAGVSKTGGRVQAEMLQDMRTVQPAIQEAAKATGGRAFPRASNMIGELTSVVEDGNAAYLLSFSPDTPPDGKYHQITVKVPGQNKIRLRYRAGYLYSKEPSALKARFEQAVWQPQDETGIGLSAHWDHASQGAAISLQIAATDIGIRQQAGRWTDKLDIFLVQRDDTGIHAAVTGQTLALDLKPDTYKKVLRDGIPFAEYIQHQQNFGTVRIIVVDENSGRMGSVTLPAIADNRASITRLF